MSAFAITGGENDMRVTNNMIMNNSIRNINKTKQTTSKLNDQMTSQKKINRPSEDPVIAIRSMRLRNSQAKIDQYLENNINDAQNWLDSAEEALKNIKKSLSDTYAELENGINGEKTLENRQIILDNIRQLRDTIYSELNADQYGRTIFTGYKTGSTLTFKEDDTTAKYTGIKETISYADVVQRNYYTASSVVPTATELAADTGNATYNSDVSVTNAREYTYYRARVSYDNIDATSTSDITVEFQNNNGEAMSSQPVLKGVTTSDEINFSSIGTNEMYFLSDTGELVMGDNVAAMVLPESGQIQITYNKTGFDKGEIRPEMYFDCEKWDPNAPDDATKTTKYTKEDQQIEFTIAENTTLTVNKQASDFISMAAYRDVDEYINAMERALDAQDKISQIEGLQASSQFANDDEKQAYLSHLKTAVQSELDYAMDNIETLFGHGITSFQGYVEDLAVAISDVGNKGSQLDLVKTRMENQQTNVEKLISDNEDKELSQIVIEYTAAYNAYESALMAASKASDNTLLDYI